MNQREAIEFCLRCHAKDLVASAFLVTVFTFGLGIPFAIILYRRGRKRIKSARNYLAKSTNPLSAFTAEKNLTDVTMRFGDFKHNVPNICFWFSKWSKAELVQVVNGSI